MIPVQNAEVGNILREDTKIDILQMPTLAASTTVVPVIDVTPNGPLQLIHFSTTGSGAVTAYTNSNNRQIEIYSLVFSMAKDAACDAATGTNQVTALIGGVVNTLASIPVITLTAANNTVVVNLAKPIRTDKGANINLSNTTGSTFTVGSMVRQVTIYCRLIQ